MLSTHAKHLFLPWLRQGLTAAIQQDDTLGAGVPGRLQLAVQLQTRADESDYSTDTVNVRFYGPGDVIGIDPQTITRTEPSHRFPSFEPNLFPFIEFDRPDFPWLFTPARANAQGQLRPWLCLVVLPRDKAKITVEPRRPLATLECQRSELPNLNESWAWAHTQLTRVGITPEPTIDTLLQEYPNNTLSRLISPRRLVEGENYIACVVPTFAAGRKAGLGETLTAADEAELTPAWSNESPSVVQLPIYHHWEFSTGFGGDFEALARRLQVRHLPPEAGVQHVDLHAPGWGMPARSHDDPASLLEMGGMLTTPATDPAEWSAQAQADFAARLREIMNGATETEDNPMVKPPLYGVEYVAVTELPAADAAPHWFRELNSDPRYRLAAGLGTMVVRYEQERLMAEAWNQLAAQRGDVESQRRAQFGSTVSSVLAAKSEGALSVNVSVSGLRSLDSDTLTPTRALVSLAGGSLARRLQLRGGVPAEAGTPLDGASAQERSLSNDSDPSLASFRFAPTFEQPVVEWVRDYFTFMLMPGLSQVQPNTIALLESDPALIEAFMVGINHEMGRELLWREFPLNASGTYFRNFWGSGGDLPPIATWSPDSHLGDHLTRGIVTAPPNPALDAQIAAKRTQVQTLTIAVATLAAQVASLTEDRIALIEAGVDDEALLNSLLRLQSTLPSRQMELQLNQNAIPALTAQAAAAIARANTLRADVSELMAQIDELNAIVAQIEALESSRTEREGQITTLTAELDALPALREQLYAQRDAAQQASQSLRETIRQMDELLATLRDLAERVRAVEAELAEQRQIVVEQDAEAVRVYSSVEPQRGRVGELLPFESRYQALQVEFNYAAAQIRKLNLRIQAHRANEPRKPEAPDRGMEAESDERGMAPGRPTPAPTPAGGRPLPGPGPVPPMPPEQDWREWKRILDELEAELAQYQHRHDAAAQAMQELEPYMQELARVRSEIADAELRANHHRDLADAARTRAAEAEIDIIKTRERIEEIEQRTAELPILRVELAQREAEVQGLNVQIDALPARQAELQNQRTAAQAEIVAFTAQIAELTPQVAELPALIEAVGPTYEEIQALEAQAANATTQAAAATERVQSITVEIANLQTQLASLPVAQAAVDSHRAALTALTATLTATVTQHHSQNTAREVAQGELLQLQQERTMSRSQLVLLIRGDLLRRFMRARIYAVEANGDAPGSNVMQPLFRQSVGTDITLLGFGLTGAQARGTNGHGGWYFVIEEPPTDVRFGLDEGEGVHRPVGDVTTWANVTWEDTVNDANALTDLTYLSVGGRLATESKPLTNDANAIAVEWGRNSAHLALITRQQPVRMVLHASTWLA